MYVDEIWPRVMSDPIPNLINPESKLLKKSHCMTSKYVPKIWIINDVNHSSFLVRDMVISNVGLDARIWVIFNLL